MDALDRMLTAANVAMADPNVRRPVRVVDAPHEIDGADAEPAVHVLESARDEHTDEEIVRAVIEAYDRKDYFACLNVRKPDCDDLGRPVWDVSAPELNRAFRKASLRVHPDKNTASDARKAFDAIGETQKLFKDETRRAEVLRKAAEEAFREKCKKDPELMRQRAKLQEKADAESYHDEMKKQRDEARRRAAEMKAKAAKMNRRKRAVDSDDDDNAMEKVAKELEEREKAQAKVGLGDDATGDDDDDGGVFIGMKRKPKKRFMF
jgi:hypothetical protein